MFSYFSVSSNRPGACPDAPDDLLRRGIEAVTCLVCAKGLLYHCMSDAEGDYVHPCQCSNADGHWARRWIGLALLSVLVPCLCCYGPLMLCYGCGRRCSVCGGRHQGVQEEHEVMMRKKKKKKKIKEQKLFSSDK